MSTGEVRIGFQAPSFAGTAVDKDGFKEISLEQYKGKYVVLFFYPLDFTFVCPTEIIEFSEKIEEFKAINCEVIGASIDSKYTHQAWLDMPRKKGGLGGLNYPLLADLKRDISIKYGVYMENEGHTCRGTFIISDKGIVRHFSMNEPPVSRNVSEVLRLVRGYQFNDVHGEVCPATWNKAGDKTIDTSNKTKFFEAQY